MRKWLPFLIGSLLCLAPSAAIAEVNPEDIPVNGTIKPSVWYVETEVIVNGTNLQGSLPSKSKVCFAPQANTEDRRCFAAGHPNITKWTESNITFTPPSNTPPTGIIALIHPYDKQVCERLYGQINCQDQQLKKVIEIGQYQAHPHIVSVMDLATNELAKSLIKGREYEIKGYRFGDSGVGIFLGFSMMPKPNIIRWTYDSIRFRPEETLAESTTLQVHNGAGKGNPWNLIGANDGTQAVKTRTRGVVMVSAFLSDQTTTTTEEEKAREIDTTKVKTEEDREEVVPTFSDIATEDPYADAIEWGTSKGFFYGYNDGSFRPLDTINRAEFLMMLLRMNGAIPPVTEDSPLFSDVPLDAWFAPPIARAVAENIVNGYDDGLFRPGNAVTSAEALKMTYRFLRIPTLDPRGDAWYARYVEHAEDHGFLIDNALDPLAPMRRQDIAWIFWKLMTFRDENH